MNRIKADIDTVLQQGRSAACGVLCVALLH